MGRAELDDDQKKNDIPIKATCPGLLSVGTRVCETPNAPRSRTMDLKNGATGSVEL